MGFICRNFWNSINNYFPDSRNTSSNNLVALINANASIQVHPKVTGPGGKKMIKSLSHGAGSSMATLASAVVSTRPLCIKK